MKCLPAVLLGVLAVTFNAQADEDEFPSAAYLGDWTLEHERFQQVWDGETLETLSIPQHFTHCAPVNTGHSILCVVESPGLKGHILWVASEDRRSVRHLSHFGERRVGVGEGTLSDGGDLALTIRFEDEPPGTYRRYTYHWLDADRYEMISRQYASDGQSTGNWYGGTFVRVVAGAQGTTEAPEP